MTCLMSKICAKADGCDIHVGTNIEKCSAFKEKQTNFSRITASPDALADFICDISFYFPWNDSEFCCRYNLETEQDRLNFVREWLKKESNNE